MSDLHPPTIEIEPMVPEMGTPTDQRPAPTTPGRRRPERPPRTDYATPYTRDEEELEPLVPDLR